METGPERQENSTFFLKRLQRWAEYGMLIVLHTFFLVAYRQYYDFWMVLLVGLAVLGLNFQLTQLREHRRTLDEHDRKRIKSDLLESVLLMGFVAIMGMGGLLAAPAGIDRFTYLALSAAALTGLYTGGLSGEAVWQLRFFHRLSSVDRSNYIGNLKRTIILPFISERRVRR